MSRIAKNPIPIQKNFKICLNGQILKVSGNKGNLEHIIHKNVEVNLTDDVLTFAPRTSSQTAKALAGTTRSLVNNMVLGVTQGFEKKLLLVGIGYRVQIQGKILNLTVGFSRPVNFNIPENITINTPSQTEIIVKGINKQQVGQIAANIRAFRPPEPYKGKGIRYVDEVIVIKEAKKK
ncbi:50S ribosomal protein L6 [Candidatus Parabeggiatoa sp. HSG14]|uniref:50S ribosomal protein L6 n=1 Tax=Candidatus Parabeggiatoa sp. HSG14 TaxID=3055593 RepID=UPI0025A90931|nr:50S ribosomal protein L6 [Thiotrichales bacterium HSG14]